MVEKAVEAGLHRETVQDAELLEQRDTGGRLLALLVLEGAAVVSEHLSFLLQQLGQHSQLEVI